LRFLQAAVPVRFLDVQIRRLGRVAVKQIKILPYFVDYLVPEEHRPILARRRAGSMYRYLPIYIHTSIARRQACAFDK
jgi:hypothetical protein